MMDTRQLDWSLLRSFLAVIDTGSLLAASKQLGTYQPTLSRHVYELERQLGVALFERTGRGLVPTAAALSIVDAARQMAAGAQGVVAGLRVAGAEARGRVRLTASEVVGSYLLPQCLAPLRESHPLIAIDVTVSNQQSNLLRRDADIALRMARPTQASLTARKIAELPIGAFAANAYLARRGKPANAKALARHELIGLDADDSLIQGLRAVKLDLDRDAFAVRTDNQVTYIRLLEAGAGIGFIPAFVARQLPDVEPVLPSLGGISIPLWLAVHREIKGNPLIRAVFDHLARSLPGAISGEIQDWQTP